MVSYNCTCVNKTTGIISQPTIIVSTCSECTNRCKEYETMVCEYRDLPSISITTFLILLVLQIILFFAMFSFSIYVLKKCKGKPRWLTFVVIALLIIWVGIGWYPGVGLGLFLILFIILMIYAIKCSKNLPKKKLNKQYFV